MSACFSDIVMITETYGQGFCRIRYTSANACFRREGTSVKIAVLDAATLGDDLSLLPLEATGEVTVYRTTKPDEVAGRIRDVDTVVINKIRLNETNLAGSNVKLICVAATGYDNIDIGWCGKHNIVVCNVVGYSTDSVAQLTVAMVLYLAQHMAEYTRFVREGEYSKSGIANRLTPAFHELSGKTWGIAGYGNIGKKVGAAAEALGCRVIVYKRSPVQDAVCVDLETLCRESDILSVHLPLNNETRGLFSRDRIALMKPDALFINVARGAVTDEQALADAVMEKRIGGIGIDVYSAEPFTENHPFYAIRMDERVCLTPHMAWGAYEARERCIREIADNIMAFRNGKLRNCVNAESISF